MQEAYLIRESYGFLKKVLDTVTQHIAVINPQGSIIYTNFAWDNFANQNFCLIKSNWEGFNYLEECKKAAKSGDEISTRVLFGLKKIINSELDEFNIEYPCDSPTEKRWFMMRVNRFDYTGENLIVIAHHDITDRKLAEDEVIRQSHTDGLTGIFNRRHFDELLNIDWRRSKRLKNPISLAIIDIDHFKLLNDTYGHLQGDDCLKKVAETLQSFAQRPSDICARYGGEEFVIAFGNTDLDVANDILIKFMQKISELNIPNEKSPSGPYLTTSIGLATLFPHSSPNIRSLFKKADKLLYKAKNNGRNRIEK